MDLKNLRHTMTVAGEQFVIDNLRKKGLLQDDQKPDTILMHYGDFPTISQLLQNKAEFINGTIILVKHKNKRESIIKALEDLSDLLAKMLKNISSPGSDMEKEILAKVVDVNMQMVLLEYFFDRNSFNDVVNEKVESMLTGDEFIKYLEIEMKENPL